MYVAFYIHSTKSKKWIGIPRMLIGVGISKKNFNFIWSRNLFSCAYDYTICTEVLTLI